jgi:UDP-N-acetylmuramyl pentapeptide synthase
MSTWIKRINQRVITYSIDSKADYRIESIEFASNGGTSFSILGYRYKINLPGRHNLYNAAAAIATAESIGCKTNEIAKALVSLKPYKLRSEVFENAGVIFINDCYNANPSSVKSAIDTLVEYPANGRKIAVLADMLELGENEKLYHREMGEYLSLRRIDALFAYGKLGELYIESFGGNFKMHFTDKKQLTSELKDYIRPGDVVLVKGSRGMALEEIGESFRGKD